VTDITRLENNFGGVYKNLHLLEGDFGSLGCFAKRRPLFFRGGEYNGSLNCLPKSRARKDWWRSRKKVHERRFRTTHQGRELRKNVPPFYGTCPTEKGRWLRWTFALVSEKEEHPQIKAGEGPLFKAKRPSHAGENDVVYAPDGGKGLGSGKGER